MKSFFEYTPADWLHLRPLTHVLKTARYRLVDRIYRGRHARHGDVQAISQLIRGRKLLVTIAFGDLQVITWQAPLVRHYVSDALYVIADNSADEKSSREIMQFAERQGIPYIRLPANPWAKGSRSHGLALNWIWHNLVLAGRPDAFGFLDHDLFPTAPDDPFAALAKQDFFGLVRATGSRWFLWAGFCMFRFDRVRNKPLDFSQDWFAGLDTGGANWRVLYRAMDRGRLQEARSTWTVYKPGIEPADGPLQWCGTWLHEVGMMGRPELRAEKRRAVADLLAPHLQRAAIADSHLPQRSD